MRYIIEDYEPYKVTVPVGECRGMRIERFFVREGDPENIRLALHNRPMIPPGKWTKLASVETGVWMSDVPAEIEDHGPFFNALFWTKPRLGGRVLINGLGLGMCLQQALKTDWVTHIDVVECDERVIHLVIPHYAEMAKTRGKSIAFHCGDAHTVKFPVGSQWDIIWHDIWPELTADNLPEIAHLKRRYAQRCDWQGAWGEEIARQMRSGAWSKAHQETMARFYVEMGLTPERMRKMEEQARADHARRVAERAAGCGGDAQGVAETAGVSL